MDNLRHGAAAGAVRHAAAVAKRRHLVHQARRHEEVRAELQVQRGRRRIENSTGAEEPTEENLTAWAKSGVTAVGMGSKLFPKEVLKAGDWASVSALCAKCLDWFKA